MSAKVEKRELTPTFWVATAALVVAVAAFAVAISGIAAASPKVIIRKGDIAPGAVTAKTLAKGAVTPPKIKNGAITTGKLSDGAVTSEKLANGSVGSSKLGGGSVTSQAIAPGAVTAGAIVPGSVGASQLGKLEVVVKPIADVDRIPHNGEWTASSIELAVCGAGAKLMGGGFAISALDNGETIWTEEMPIINGEINAVAGRLTSDAGGVAGGTIAAICLAP